MNKHRILLTCFGSKIARDFIVDFGKRNDIELCVGDANPQSAISYCSPHFIPLRSGDDPEFCQDLLEKARQYKIKMIIPGGDEDALALMGQREQFEKEGIVVAVQRKELIPIFQSKTAQYDYLHSKGFPVPRYERVCTNEEFARALEKFEYPQYPLILKPNFGRGGKGIAIISEKMMANKDNLSIFDQRFTRQLFDENIEYIITRYTNGVIYDIDVLRYKDGSHFFGVRKRLGTNVTKLFSGNMFDARETILEFSKKIYEAMPTEYLVDYDVMVGDGGSMELLEINPRPSGSAISYLPFGINLYYVLAKSYLDGEHIDIDQAQLAGHSAHTFYTMVSDLPL